MGKKKVFINVNDTCTRRYLDGSRLEKYFKSNGYKCVGIPQKADYIIFVTCSFKKTKEEECWQCIEDYRKYRGELIVVGCLPEVTPVKFNQKFKGKYVSTKDLNEIDQFFSEFKIKFKDIPDTHQFLNMPYQQSSLRRLWKRLFVLGVTISYLKETAGRIKIRLKKALTSVSSEYAYLRICDGCVEQCAYCCIYRAVGKLRSKSIQACVGEYKDILRRGYYKIHIVADNVGAYGLDIKSSLPELLNNLSASYNKKAYWSIQDLHPRWAILYKTELLKMAEEKKLQMIVCPIQSGSNRILKLMNRHHSIEEIKNFFLGLKKVNPGFILHTHVIIGFPSETEEDFHETLNVLQEIRFDYMAIYPYYDGYDTVASKMDDKVDEATIRRRVSIAVDFLKREKLPFKCDDELELITNQPDADLFHKA